MRTFIIHTIAGVAIVVAIWGIVNTAEIWSAKDQARQRLIEECIVLKHEKNAEKFLDKQCNYYVNYKQDNN